MTTNQLINAFNVSYDEFGSAYIDTDRVLQFLNQAQLERLKRLIPDDQGGQVNYELDENTLFNVRPLIYDIDATLSAGGITTFAALNTALRTASGDAGCNLHRILKVSYSSNKIPAKFTKHNNWNSYKQNSFKSGTEDFPRYSIDAVNMSFLPAQAASITITAMKTPRVMEVGNTPDFDDSNLNLILEIALQLASQPVKDNEMIGIIQNSNIAK